MMRRRVVCQFKTLDLDKESSMKRGLCWLIIVPGVLVSCRSGREEGTPPGINPTTLMWYTHPVAMTSTADGVSVFETEENAVYQVTRR
jgi:hypothetical protein